MENKKYKAPLSHLLNPGHSACAGCGMIIAARLLTDTIGANSIMTSATGCSEVTTTQYPMTSFKIPWIHSLFENSSTLATGISAELAHGSIRISMGRETTMADIRYVLKVFPKVINKVRKMSTAY